MSSIPFLTVVLLFLSLPARAQVDAQELHEYWTQRLKSATAVQLVARSSAAGNARLVIKAERNNKYRIEMPGRVIVCDGKKVRNYSVLSNSVVVSTFRPDQSVMSVERLLLDVITSYAPVSLKNSNESASGTFYLLHLEPRGKELFGVRSLDLRLDKRTRNIHAIEINSAQGKQSWTIEALQLKASLPSSTFVLKTPKNCDVISMDGK